MTRVGLVLAGAAARGPYQAGALAELLPALAAEGHRPTVLLGTSSGGITAALTAQYAHLDAADAGERIVETWVDFGRVFALAARPALLLIGRLAGAPLPAVAGMMDVTPLREHATALFAPERVAANVASGHVETLAVAATVCPPARSAARTRLFVQGALPVRPLHRYIDVVGVPLTVDHLLASAAIPMVFPPVHIAQPPSHAGWYVDGGVRLNCPLDPALATGIDRLVVVSGHSVDPPPVPPEPAGRPPDLAATGALSVRAILADALGDDLRALAGDPDRVPHLLVAPPDGALAGLAAEAFAPDGLLDPSWTIERLLAALGGAAGRDELLSLILFQRAYAERLVDRGRRDARAALDAGWVS